MNSDWLLNYPVWELYAFGGGFLIAVMAVVHVYVAHFAVGGGLFLVLTEMKGYRENSQAILDYTKKHTRFFLLLTMVFGSITGVGIWFTISLLSPDATSVLIHQFVFAWATEWVFFAGEIAALFVYYYTFGKMNRKDHLTVGWIYFVFGWLSLFVVNGIITFMLTPGKWPETKNFWDAFFNPSAMPSLFFRTCMAFMLAGLFGFITTVRMKEKDCRDIMLRYCSWWLLLPLLFLTEAAWWYAATLPEPQKAMIFSRSPEILPFLKAFLWLSPVIFVIGVLMAVRVSEKLKPVLAIVLLFIGLAYMGSFEWIREAGRRPYIIYGYVYSNVALAEDIDAINNAGLLKSARWTRHKEITDENQIEAGREIFRLLCISCHSVDGRINDILPLTKKFSVFGMDAFLDGMGKINDYMPPFIGNAKERKALAMYIVNELGSQDTGHKLQKSDFSQKSDLFESQQPTANSQQPIAISEFNEETDEYILLAWSGKGMYYVSDCNQYFTLSSPGNDIYAQLIRRGETPEIVREGVTITYHLEKAYGIMNFDEKFDTYTAKEIPVSPYQKSDSTSHFNFNPYPLVTIEARDTDTDNLLVSTQIVAPISTEMNCKTCHGGKWRTNDIAGISDETADDILRVHDRMSKTNLTQMARNGQPKSCQECHQQKNLRGFQNPAGLLNLSASIHGFHAVYLTNRGADACMGCHPETPDTFTKGFRGIHKTLEFDCINCHGKMEDHALSLLKAEKDAGKKGADKLIKHLAPRAVDSVEDINPREPWINEPDCLNCHVDFNPPDTDTSEFNLWTKTENQLYRMRSDDVGIKCAACHGITHAIYPANNIFGNNRDNIPPMQYQKMPYPIAANKNCKVCHTIDMEEEVHHPNSLRMFRN